MPQQNARNTYLRVRDALRHDIVTEAITSALPSKSTLAKYFGVSISTIERALRALRQEGLIETRQGMGTYVTGTGDRRPTVERLADYILTFEPGEMIPTEVELAQHIGVSRTTLRFAIAHLEGQGLLGRCGQRRLVVRSVPAPAAKTAREPR